MFRVLFFFVEKLRPQDFVNDCMCYRQNSYLQINILLSHILISIWKYLQIFFSRPYLLHYYCIFSKSIYFISYCEQVVLVYEHV